MKGAVRATTACSSSAQYAPSTDWEAQYDHAYYIRLQKLRPQFRPPASWNDGSRAVSCVLDLQVGEPAWVSGTVVRECVNKPNILADLQNINHGRAPQHAVKYCDPADKLFLEDEHGRMELVGIGDALLVTGMVVGVLGGQNALGEFEVRDVCYPSPSAPTPLPTPPTKGPSTKIALVSGLDLPGRGDDDLCAALASMPEIAQIVICGNLLHPPVEKLVSTRVMRTPPKPDTLAQLDAAVTKLANMLPVRLMPGAADPTSVAFPQAPISPALFARARAVYERISFETNPQLFKFGETEVLGTSGQPIADLGRYLEDEITPEIELELLNHTLEWGHIAPTAPDTLWSPPCKVDDPLVVSAAPHVLFAGNCTGFATDVRAGVRMVCVPRFSKNGEFVVLDLETLEVELLYA